MPKKNKTNKLSEKKQLFEEIKADKGEQSLADKLKQEGMDSTTLGREMLITEDLVLDRTLDTAKHRTPLNPLVDLVKNSPTKISAAKFATKFQKLMGNTTLAAFLGVVKIKHGIAMHEGDNLAVAEHAKKAHELSEILQPFGSKDAFKEVSDQLSEAARRSLKLSGMDMASNIVADELNGLTRESVLAQLNFEKAKTPKTPGSSRMFKNIEWLINDYYDQGEQSFLVKDNTSFEKLNEVEFTNFGDKETKHPSMLSSKELKKHIDKYNTLVAQQSEFNMGDVLERIVEGAKKLQDRQKEGWVASVNSADEDRKPPAQSNPR